MDYAKISSINKLRNAKKENDIRLKKAESVLYENLSSIRASLHLDSFFIKLGYDYLSLASHLRFYHQGYLWLRSLLHKFSNTTDNERQNNCK